jgi:hypothetical protein
MNNCSICGWGVAWCVDKEDKGTYWLCGRCAVDYYRDKIKSERLLVRVARAADVYWTYGDGEAGKNEAELGAALKELPPGFRDA